jgi:hypothetical protein
MSDLPAGGGGSEAGEAITLSIPDWVPVAVAAQAADMWRHVTAFGLNSPFWLNALPGLARLRRLVCDERMGRVWCELQRMKRDGSGFVNPAWGGHKQSNESQQESMLWLFNLVAGYGNPLLVVRTHSEVDTERAKLVDAAEKLRSVSRIVSSFAPLRSEAIAAEANALCKEVERRYGAPNGVNIQKLVVKRHRGDPHLRAFIIMTATACKTCFDASLYGTVATIANVAFNRRDKNGRWARLTGLKVREIVRR